MAKFDISGFPSSEDISSNHSSNSSRLLPSKRQFSDLDDQQYLFSGNRSNSDLLKPIHVSQKENEPEINGHNFPSRSMYKSGFDHTDSTSAAMDKENDNNESSNPETGQKESLKHNALFDDNLNGNCHSNFSDVLGQLGQEAKMIVLQYSQTFSDSELYEQQVLQAVTDLTAHARVLEQHLNLQKELLCNRLKNITYNLKNEI